MTHQPDTPNILIVDDTPSNLSVVVDLFESRGYRVAIAQDGEEGLQRAQLVLPSLILLDVMLPGANGFEICRRLKTDETTRDIPVIFMTSLASVEHKVNGFDAGGVDYLTKPLQIDEVMARVDTHLRLHAAQRQLEQQNAQLAKHGEELERRVAERTAELAAREREFRTLTENAPDNIIRYDTRGRMIYINSRLMRTMGVKGEQLLGKTSLEAYPDGRYSDYHAKVMQVAGSGEPGEIEIVVPGAGGGAGYHHISFVAEQDAAGAVCGVLGIGRDITERKRMEQALLVREAELRSVTDSSPYSIIRYDLAGRMTYANAPLLGYFGIPLDGLFGKLPREVWPDGRYAEIDRGIARVRETAQSVVVEFSETTAGGEILYHQIWIAPERGASGDVVGFVAFGTDITERRRAERELHLLNRALDNSFDATYLLDTDLRFLYVNEAATRALGYSREELLSLTLLDIDPNVTREMVHGLMEQTAVTGHFPGVVESRHRRKSGETFPIEVGASTFSYEDETLFLTAVRDITERKRMEEALRTSEREFRSLAENSPDIIMRYDLECRRTYVNPAYERDIEIPSDVALSVIPDAGQWRASNMSVDEYKAWMRQVMATWEAQERIVEWIRVSDGAVSYFAVRMVAERDADGRTVGVLAIGRNITELKRAERELEESRTQLRGLTARREEVREEERKYIAREVHDELGQILTGLQLNVSVLTHKFAADSVPLREQLQETMMLTDRALGVARNVASALRPAALDMGIISALEWLAARFSLNTGIKCEVHVEELEIPLDESHAIALFRIVQESLTNVARHARADRIDIVLGRVGDDCSLKVRDNGAGFDLRAMKKTDSFGLVGMRERALLLGGEVIINSRLGEGTEVEVHIPAHNISRAL